MELYIIRSGDGVETKPLSIDEVKSLIQNEGVKGTSMVFTESSQKWRLAASIPEVRALIREFNVGQDRVLDRIRTEGMESKTSILKAKRKIQEDAQRPFWKRIFGVSEKEKK